MYVAMRDLFGSGFSDIEYFAYKMQMVICQRVIEIHDHIVVTDLLNKAHQLVAIGIVHHQFFTFFHTFFIKFAVNLKGIFRDLGNHFLVGKSIGALRIDFEIKFITYFFIQQVFFEIR